MTEAIESFEFQRAALGLYDFVYGELCDWYLEMVKPRLYAQDADRQAVSATLLYVLTETLELAHPVIPFVTEEIWSYVPGAEGLLAGRAATGFEAAWLDPEAEGRVGRAIAAVQELRGWRDRVEVRPGDLVPARLSAEGYEDTIEQVARLARLELSAEELDRYTGQLAAVHEHAADVEALALDGVPPTAHPLPLVNVLREDEPRPSLDREEVLAAAPAAEDGRFLVPPVLGEAP